jgi:hypothetical protein
VKHKERVKRENYYIAKFLKDGHDLLNNRNTRISIFRDIIIKTV